MSTPMPDFEVIKRTIRQRHIEQLRDLNIVADPFESFQIGATFYDLNQWTNYGETQIKKGKANSEPQILCTLL